MRHLLWKLKRKLKRRPRKSLFCRIVPRWNDLESILRCCQTKHWHQETPATSPPFWDVGRDKSEGLNRRIEYKHQHTIHIISPPSMPKLRGFQQGLYGYVDVLPGTLTFNGVLQPWNVLPNSVGSFARGISWEDLDRPNAWRHYESETDIETEDVLQATHWMHSMTAHTPEVLCGKWLNLEVTVGVAVSTSKCSQTSSAQNDHSHGANAYHFQRDWPAVAPHDSSVWFASPLRAIFQRLNDWQWNVFRHNLTPIEPVFDDDAKHEPWPET